MSSCPACLFVEPESFLNLRSFRFSSYILVSRFIHNPDYLLRNNNNLTEILMICNLDRQKSWKRKTQG